MKCKPLYCACLCTIPQRFITVLLCTFGVFVFYAQRKGLGFLIYEVGAFLWDDLAIDVIVLFFHVGYLAGLWIGSLADRYGGKWLCCAGMALSTLAFSLLPILNSYAPWYVLSIDVLVLSLGQGSFYPSIFVLIARWVPPSERATSGALVLGATPLAITLGRLSLKFPEETFREYTNVFYYWSGVSVLWCILFAAFIYNSPREHPFITEKEKTFLQTEIVENVYVPFKASILVDVGILTLLLGQVGHIATVYLLTESVRLYFEKKQWTGLEIGILMLPLLAGLWITAVSFGVVFDYHINKKKWDLLKTRRLAVCIAFPLTSIFIVAFVYVQYIVSMYLAYTLALFFKSMHYGSLKVNLMDITVNHVAIITTMLETEGYISYYLTRSLNSFVSIEAWDTMSWFAFVINMLYMPSYYFSVKAHRASWDMPDGYQPASPSEPSTSVKND